MQELKTLGVRSIILTSGTLSPLDSFREDMKLPFIRVRKQGGDGSKEEGGSNGKTEKKVKKRKIAFKGKKNVK
jgi:hypothetical protein